VNARAEELFLMDAGAKAAAEPRKRAVMATVNCIFRMSQEWKNESYG
jgi:hypothetical protein